MSRKKLKAEEGSGLISDVYQNIKGRFSGRRTDFAPAIRQFLGKEGNSRITGITVYRTPVQSYVGTILNVLSLGQFKQKINKLGFDTMFHLYMKVDYNSSDNSIKSILIEKNQVINIAPWNEARDAPANAQSLKLELPPQVADITINSLLYNGMNKVGKQHFFHYDGFSDNCQAFLLTLLDASNILQYNPTAKTFIYQDLTTLKNELTTTGKISKGVTDFASTLDTVIHGKGLQLDGRGLDLGF